MKKSKSVSVGHINPNHGSLQWFGEVRTLLDPVPVDTENIWPAWFRKQYKLITGKSCFTYTPVNEVCDKAGVDWMLLFDHHGISKLPTGEAVIVTEPYGGVQHVQEAVKFAKFFGLEVQLCANSYWYPGITIRLEFSLPKQDPGK